jgi:hypothetical protein
LGEGGFRLWALGFRGKRGFGLWALGNMEVSVWRLGNSILICNPKA